MSEESQTQSVQARIAALNLSHVGRAPVTADGSPPEPPPTYQRSHSTTVAQPLGHNSLASNGIGNEPNGPRRDGVLPPPTNITRTGHVAPQPAKPIAPPPRLPTRKPSTQPFPALPPRRYSGQLSRKASNESVSSTVSNTSSISALSNGTARTYTPRTPSIDAGNRVKAPVFDPTTLPPLPPKRTKHEIEKRYQDIEKSKAFPGYKDAERAKISLNATKSAPHIATVEVSPPQTTPVLPPRRPTRKESGGSPRKTPTEQPPPMPERPARSALSLGMNKVEEPGHINEVNGRHPSPSPSGAGAPPPIPLASRPDITKLQATKPKAQSQAPPSASSCLICRDFSGPDTHATKFPRQNVPSLDWLATQLTTPFPSLTDKARAIFTWLHHNIDYDVANFFNGTVQPSTPASTLATGLAVCEGYAGLFTALATKAGLESVVIGGHGKGFSFSFLNSGDPIPPESLGHAWNAVKIDNKQWKLIDPCWGAGNVNGRGQPYNRQFSPKFFTMSNEEFGLRHFPQNKAQFFRSDGWNPTWEEYIVGEPGGELLQLYGIADQEGMSEISFIPKYKALPVSPSAYPGPTIRFQFSRVCGHWDPVRNGRGKDFVYILAIHGIDGREDDYVPFGSNGIFWWADVVPKKLGAPGQKVSIYAVDTVGGVDARGLSVDEYLMAKGRKGMGFQSLCMWVLI